MSENITLFFVAIIIKNCQENPVMLASGMNWQNN
jgi:hypothetical protein